MPCVDVVKVNVTVEAARKDNGDDGAKVTGGSLSAARLGADKPEREHSGALSVDSR